jgi:activator of 2-hydroxyglutaryl-CoA dehydratase
MKLGIDIGSTSLKGIILNQENQVILSGDTHGSASCFQFFRYFLDLLDVGHSFNRG